MKEHSIRATVYYVLKWLVISFILAILCGSIISIYILAINKGEQVRSLHPAMILGLPFVGAAVTYMYQYFHLTSQVGNKLLIAKANGSEEKIPFRAIPVSMLGTIVSHWFGASIGREDIATQLAGGVIDQVDQHFHFRFTDIEKQWLITCGLGAGFACTFGTPVAGTLFALEISKARSFRLDAIYPVFMTSLLSYWVTTCFGLHQRGVFSVVGYPKEELVTFVWLFVISILFACVGRCYRFGISLVQKTMQSWIKNPVWITFLGGLIVIVLTLIFHNIEYLGLSSAMQKEAIDGTPAPFGFFWKLLYTMICVGTGFRGGTLTPLFDIGSNFGHFLSRWVPLDTSFISALGFLGVFAAATNTPLTCFILGIELFGGKGAIFFFFVTITSYICSGKYSIFTQK